MFALITVSKGRAGWVGWEDSPDWEVVVVGEELSEGGGVGRSLCLVPFSFSWAR